jgi:subtilase family serine protease
VRIGPDLLVPSLTAPSSVVRGVAFNVTDTTRNDGAAAAGITTTSYYLSTNTSLDGSDLLLGSRPVSGLAPGASEAGQASVTVPAGQAAGTYYIIAKADAPNALVEFNEANNTRTRSFRVDP